MSIPAKFIMTAVWFGFTLVARADIMSFSFASGFAGGGIIPDGNATGWSDQRTITGLNQGAIGDITLKLNVTGGFNGDLYGYLSHGGMLVPLFNRVGVTANSGGNSFGYSDSGFFVTLTSSANNDIHFYGAKNPVLDAGRLTGTWQPDGRVVDPLASPSQNDAASRISFDAFNGVNPNGQWTLFFADVSGGGGPSQVLSWELDISPVPEASTWLAIPFLVSIIILERFRAKRKTA